MHGMQIQATGVICVLVCATLGTLGTHWAGARLLERAPHADEERERLAEAVPPAHDPALCVYFVSLGRLFLPMSMKKLSFSARTVG
jgi:hypothetical protein